MSQRWVLLALGALAGLLLLWTVATWPTVSEDAANAASDQPEAAKEAVVPVEKPLSPPPTAAAEPAQADEPEPQLQAAEQPIPEAAESPEAQADKLFVRENGPLSDYKAKFESEPRDSAASDAEVEIRGSFVATDGPKPVFRSVLCRETICKIETRISEASMGAYVAAMMRIVHEKFDNKLATERTSLVEGNEVSLVVYAKRKRAEH